MIIQLQKSVGHSIYLEALIITGKTIKLLIEKITIILFIQAIQPMIRMVIKSLKKRLLLLLNNTVINIPLQDIG